MSLLVRTKANGVQCLVLVAIPFSLRNTPGNAQRTRPCFLSGVAMRLTAKLLMIGNSATPVSEVDQVERRPQ